MSNVNQQLAFMRLRKSVEDVEPGKHIITEHDLNIRMVVRCSCGWQHNEHMRQNALARAAKLRSAARRHLQDVVARHSQEPKS